MVDAISTKTVSSAKPAVADAPSAAVAAAQSAAIAQSKATGGQPLNPRLVYDKLAGVVVTQFLSQSGNVQLQSPSAAVLAYLRVGLGADGRSKYQPEPEAQPEKQNPDITFDS